MTLDDALKIVGPLIAIYGISTWRLQIVGKRRFEVAEGVVLAVYRVKEALSWIRTDAYINSEADNRERADGETPYQRRALDRYYIPLKRVDETKELFAELQKQRLLCVLHFGQETGAPFDTLISLRAQIIAHAQSLMRLVRNGGHPDNNDPQGNFPKLEAKLWGWCDEEDKDWKSVEGAVAKIEAVCRPHLAPPNVLASMIAALRKLGDQGDGEVDRKTGA